jgi:dCTP deaminase
MATLDMGRAGSELFPSDAPETGSVADPAALQSGILPAQDIRDLIEKGHVAAESPVEAGQIQPASLDLRLGPTAYRVQASFLPGKIWTVKERIQSLYMAELDLSKPTVLERGCIYIVPLQEHLSLPPEYVGERQS